jgi:NADPH-dependent 2,4-dienoyl-CoA reductase/sulfur reductase-like enzyme
MNDELVVIGAGPAGLCAAIEASRHGVKVLLIDENDRPGGQLFLQTHKFFGSRHHMAGVRGLQIGNDLLQEAKGHGIELLLDTVVWGVFPDGRVAFTRGGGGQGPSQGSIVAKNILLATGAVEKAAFFKGWTRPGVMGAGAAQKMMHVHRVLPGKRVLMVGSGNVGLIVSYQLAQAGARVVGVIEMLPDVGGYQVHAGKIRRLGIPILTSHTIVEALGDPAVTGAVIARTGPDGKPLAGAEIEVSCDLICLAVGLRPFDELARASGLPMKYVGKAGGFVPLHDENMETAKRGVYVAGDLSGIEEANTAMDEGRLAGIAVAERLGRLPNAKAEGLKNEIRGRLANLRIGSFGFERAAAKETILAGLKDLSGVKAAPHE